MINLTDEQLNIAICEWRGWTSIVADVTGRYCGYHLKDKPERHTRDYLPSHILGIEALGNMHEVEKEAYKKEPIGFATKYDEAIRDITAKAHDVLEYNYSWHATARQRAIALLRVVKPELFKS